MVESARGIGSWSQADDCVVLRSESKNPGQVRNVGLDWVTANGGGMVAFMDDDDLYFESHLAALVEAWKPGRVVGKNSHYIRTRGDRLYRIQQDVGEVKQLMPQTAYGHSSDIQHWRILDAEREDPDWCIAMRSAGAELWSVESSDGFCLWSHGGRHAWMPPDHEWAVRVDNVRDLGPFDAGIVAGVSVAPVGVRLSPSLDDVRSMLVRTGVISAAITESRADT